MTKTTFALVVAAAVFLGSCQRTGLPVSPSSLSSLRVDDLVTALTVNNSQGASKSGLAPASAGGPAIIVAGNQTVINGGTLPVTISGGGPFDVVYMYVSARSVGLANGSPGGVDGYYEVHLPFSQTSATVLLSFSQTLPLPQFQLLFAVSNSSGPVGPFATLDTTAITVGTGDIQVSLSWDVDSDVDLHVVDPSGEEIYYAHRQSASNGTLDLDSNAGCDLDHKRNENVTWPIGRAPRRTYTVRVDYWSNCQVAQTNYTVRIYGDQRCDPRRDCVPDGGGIRASRGISAGPERDNSAGIPSCRCHGGSSRGRAGPRLRGSGSRRGDRGPAGSLV